MENDEISCYQELSKIQKDFADALLVLGFKWKYFNQYEKIGWGVINVVKFNRWSDLLQLVHDQGKDQKRFEIQRVLGIY